MPRLLTGVRVLVVEDSAETRGSMAGALRAEGAEVHEADSAQTALLLVEGLCPDVLVVGLELPEVDGYALLKAVRRLAPAAGRPATAIALTARPPAEERRRALLAGFRLLLPRSIAPGELAAKLASVLVLFGRFATK